MIDQFFSRISRLVFVVTFFTISISFAGLMYIDGLSNKLGFNVSLFDLTFYDFFIYVVISDNLNIFIGFILSLAISVSFVLYPKAIIFVYDFIYICLLCLWKFFGGSKKIVPFFVFFISPFLILPVVVFLISHCVVIKIKEIKAFENHLLTVVKEVNEDEQYLKSSSRLGEGSHNFFKSYLVFSFVLLLFIAWLGWVVHIGKQGQVHAQKFLDSKEYKTLYLTNNTKRRVVMVSKVKNGYIFVLNENNKNKTKASFIPDSVILRIDSF